MGLIEKLMGFVFGGGIQSTSEVFSRKFGKISRACACIATRGNRPI